MRGLKYYNSGDKLMDSVAYVLVLILFILFTLGTVFKYSFYDKFFSMIGAMLCIYILFKTSPWNQS